MTIETIRMSSKGQIVIPRDVREEIDADEGTLFAVLAGKDSVVLKKIKTPSKDDLIREMEVIAKEGRKRLEAKGIRESDISGIVERASAR